MPKSPKKHPTIINECKWAEQQLREGYFCFTLSRLVFVNNAMVRLFKFDTSKELFQSPIEHLFANEMGYAGLIYRARIENTILNNRILLRKNTGENFWAHVSLKKRMMKGQEYFEGIITEITETIQAENQLKEIQQKHDKLSHEFDRFVYSASHEMRSPIATSKGLLNLMRLEIKDSDHLRYVKLLDASITKLDSYISDLAIFASTSKRAMHVDTINFKNMLTTILDHLKSNHDYYNKVTWDFSIKDEVPFYSDSSLLLLILKILLKNSLDYYDTAKSAPLISIQIENLHEKTNIDIVDNGIGIESSHLNSVFDLFYKATTISKGTGIGLFVAREAVTQLNGIISIHSKYRVGTNVKLQIPNAGNSSIPE